MEALSMSKSFWKSYFRSSREELCLFDPQERHMLFIRTIEPVALIMAYASKNLPRINDAIFLLNLLEAGFLDYMDWLMSELETLDDYTMSKFLCNRSKVAANLCRNRSDGAA